MLILASKSASRQAMLRDAGVSFETQPADLDERAIESRMSGESPDKIVQVLAESKAMAVAGSAQLVLGSDSLVVVEGKRFDKPTSRENAAEHLRFFSGKVMELYTAAALVRDGAVIWRHTSLAKLKVRELSEAFIIDYLDAEWPAVSSCVGVFRIEGLGVQLFESIEGSHFTVLGMPLLPVLGALRDLGEIPQ